MPSDLVVPLYGPGALQQVHGPEHAVLSEPLPDINNGPLEVLFLVLLGRGAKQVVLLAEIALYPIGNSDAEATFRKVDAAIQAALLEAALAKHPQMQKQKVINKYWYKEIDGRYCYSLPQDRSVRLIRLADKLLIHHSKIKTNANPFLDTDYMEGRSHERDIRNVNGPYRAVWERQNGRCYYCGRRILTDQPRTVVPRTVVPLDLSRRPSPLNTAYIHERCAQNEFELVYTMDDLTITHPYDILASLQNIAVTTDNRALSGKRFKEIPDDWMHRKFKQYLSQSTAASITLTFKEVEKIDECKLPPTAFKYHAFWYRRPTGCNIADAWDTEGYKLKKLDMKNQKIYLVREQAGMSRINFPDALMSNKVPADAAFEMEQFMDYIIKRYGL